MRVLSLYKVDLSHSFEANYPQLVTLEEEEHLRFHTMPTGI